MTHMCKHVIDLSNRFKNIIKNKGVFNDLVCVFFYCDWLSIYCRFEMVTEMFFLTQNDFSSFVTDMVDRLQSTKTGGCECFTSCCVCEHLTHYSFSLVSHLQVLQNLSFLWSPPAPQQPFTKNYQRLQVVNTNDWLPPFIHLNTLTHTWNSAEVGQLVCEAWRSVSGTASSRRPGRARSSRTAGRWARRDPFSRRMTRGWREWSRGKREAGTARGCGCMILCRMATERWMTKIQKGAGAQVALCPL